VPYSAISPRGQLDAVCPCSACCRRARAQQAHDGDGGDGSHSALSAGGSAIGEGCRRNRRLPEVNSQHEQAPRKSAGWLRAIVPPFRGGRRSTTSRSPSPHSKPADIHAEQRNATFQPKWRPMGSHQIAAAQERVAEQECPNRRCWRMRTVALGWPSANRAKTMPTGRMWRRGPQRPAEAESHSRGRTVPRPRAGGQQNGPGRSWRRGRLLRGRAHHCDAPQEAAAPAPGRRANAAGEAEQQVVRRSPVQPQAGVAQRSGLRKCAAPASWRTPRPGSQSLSCR